MHARHCEVPALHLLSEPVDLPAGVAVDDGLCDGQSSVQIAQGLKFPLLLLDGDVELLDTLQGQLVSLHQDADGVSHELSGHFEHFQRHGGGEDGALDGLGHEFENVVDLFFKSSRQHLVSLVEH